jgi:mannose/fructose/N-acetylgalactosamine-specific phosphotransferase system component IIC
MLWSIQLGIVILVAGVGLQIVSYKLSNYEDAVTGFQVVGGIVIALGIGFILSSLGSYLISRRLGLMDPSPSPPAK